MLADFAVVLDANVLAESALGDLFLRLSEEPRLLLPKWTETILEETERTLVQTLGWAPGVAASRLAAMREWFPEAMIEDYEPFIARCRNDERDRHVLAAAIREGVETIVTMNAKHFRPEHLEPWGVNASHPDAYLRVLFDHDAGAVVQALNGMAQARRKPLAQLLSRLSQPAPDFAAHVAGSLAIGLPRYDKEAYRSSQEHGSP